MATLVAPDVRFHRSWLEGVAEFAGAHADGGGMPAPGPDLAALRDLDRFARFVDALKADDREETPTPRGTCRRRPSGWWRATGSWASCRSGTA